MSEQNAVYLEKLSREIREPRLAMIAAEIREGAKREQSLRDRLADKEKTVIEQIQGGVNVAMKLDEIIEKLELLTNLVMK